MLAVVCNLMKITQWVIFIAHLAELGITFDIYKQLRLFFNQLKLQFLSKALYIFDLWQKEPSLRLRYHLLDIFIILGRQLIPRN